VVNETVVVDSDEENKLSDASVVTRKEDMSVSVTLLSAVVFVSVE
jgi:hypothetical protein